MSALKLMVTIIVGLMVALPVLALPVPAQLWDENDPNDELNLFEIYNAVYGTNLASNDELEAYALSPDDVFTCLLGADVEARARYAAFGQAVGYYDENGDSEPVAVSGFGLNASATLSIPAGTFGLYDQVTGGGDNRWYSDPALNGGDDHMVAYWGQNGDIFIGFEDQACQNPCVDYDYNDLVLTLRCSVIPEPATILLMGFGMAGLGIRSLRRHSKK